jgi:uncharacterized phage protein (TIGR02218 family)
MSSILSGDKRVEGGFGEVGSRVVGAIDDETISEEDIRLGRFRNATVEEYLVDWRYPMADYISFRRYWLRDFSYEAGVWRANAQGVVSQLKKRIGRLHKKRCGLELGAGYTCKADIVTRSVYYVEVATVTANYQLTIDTSDLVAKARFDYIATTYGNGTIFDDNWFNFGVCEFITGEGAGQRYSINDSSDPGNGVDKNVDLIQSPPFTIAAGDRVNLIVGCDRLFSTCRDKFSNAVNFGGYPTLPGTDKLLNNPAFV